MQSARCYPPVCPEAASRSDHWEQPQTWYQLLRVLQLKHKEAQSFRTFKKKVLVGSRNSVGDVAPQLTPTLHCREGRMGLLQ